MPTGACHLCRRLQGLQDSHYIAAGFFRTLRGDSGKGHPTVITPKRQVMTDAQIRARLLCSECEQRFHRNGEDWVLDHFWRSDTQFRLRDALKAAPRAASSDGSFYVHGPSSNVDVDKLVYFAASVFWRGTLQWRRLGGLGRPAQLDLGRYAEELRQFLLGERSFPTNIVLHTFASTWKVRLGEVTYPYIRGRGPGVRRFCFMVPGLSFEMWVGGGVSAIARAFCTARSRVILAAPDVDRLNFADTLKLHSLGRPAGKRLTRGSHTRATPPKK